MSETPMLPLPPDEISIEAHVKREWDNVLRSWKSGWAPESNLTALESYIEFHRVRLFVEGWADGVYDWQHDWALAKYAHDINTDFVKNRRALNDDLKKMWFEWSERQYTFYGNVSLEALRSMVLINGAAILASLAVLSGQIVSPSHAAVIVSKATVFTSVISLLLMATGHSILFARVSDANSRIRGVLNGNPRHRRLYAISRYLRRYVDPVLEIANYCIYGSIGIFGLSALICSIILMIG